MLIRRKSSTDDEYHHEDPLGVFGVITGANGAVLSSYVYDAFMAQRYVPVPSKHPAKCYVAMSEPNILTGSGGRGVVVPSRGFQVMGKKPAPAKKHPCKPAHHGFPWHKVITCLKDIAVGLAVDSITALFASSTECKACQAAVPECCGALPEFCELCEELCADVCGSKLMTCFKNIISKGTLTGVIKCFADVL